ncbi:zeta toxin family protein [Planctomicrobium piriforme]|uniref:zeta toxin family protein n=1 Tax=Planctomicrobium piriforme TaxID=1576369 RepID=UPI001C31246D|nr:zeta toxin family protein [Planctomicrobium piriforme]
MADLETGLPASGTAKPAAYVIAGPNGAGKTTFATTFLPHFADCQEFLNADLIAAGLSPFAPEGQAIRAGRLQLERINELIAARQSFAFETTLSGRSYQHLFSRLNAQGYEVAIFFLWLPEVEIAVDRVANRVSQGGHRIPEDVIRRRYHLGIRNAFEIYFPLVTNWRLFDGSHSPPWPIATNKLHKLTIHDAALFERISKQVRESETVDGERA